MAVADSVTKSSHIVKKSQEYPFYDTGRTFDKPISYMEVALSDWKE